MKFGAVENKARFAIIIFAIALLALGGLSLILYLQARGQSESSPIIIYFFSYQIIALLFGLGLVFLLVRWLLRPYRRMVEAARGSPVHATAAMSESEFVVETFQALIEQLQSKEKELAQLHALERKRAERSERFSERLIANIPSGLVTVDSKGKVTSVNAHAMRILGTAEPNASTGVDFASFFHMSDRVVDMISKCLETGKAFRREEVNVRLADGRARHLGLSVSPIADASQNIEGALCLLTDITEVLELRERMKLQENLANLGEMAAGLAHEFKNSLATIQGYVQLLEVQLAAGSSTDNHREALDSTLNEVRLLARLVTDFLNFARPQHLNLTSVDLRSVIEDCAAEVKPLLEENGIELRIEGEFTRVAADEALLRRVFVNLFRNAAEATDPLSTEKRITVTGEFETRYAHARVSDTGTGISNEDLHRIFIPFFTTKSRGYGIGLAIVQKILMAHGGDVAVEKSDIAGTTFHCRLPISTPEQSVEP
ncbi:MAG TPA: ATP-binding protein [Blastocatellia bacterium]|nr:ATP-binding protein [Blastocatellia bacterium]